MPARERVGSPRPPGYCRVCLARRGYRGAARGGFAPPTGPGGPRRELRQAGRSRHRPDRPAADGPVLGCRHATLAPHLQRPETAPPACGRPSSPQARRQGSGPPVSRDLPKPTSRPHSSRPLGAAPVVRHTGTAAPAGAGIGPTPDRPHTPETANTRRRLRDGPHPTRRAHKPPPAASPRILVSDHRAGHRPPAAARLPPPNHLDHLAWPTHIPPHPLHASGNTPAPVAPQSPANPRHRPTQHQSHPGPPQPGVDPLRRPPATAPPPPTHTPTPKANQPRKQVRAARLFTSRIVLPPERRWAADNGNVNPETLARQLGVSAKTLRAWLRRDYPRRPGERGASWWLTDEQVDAARTRWSGRSALAPRAQPSGAVRRRAGRALSDEH